MTPKEQQQVDAQRRAWSYLQCIYNFPLPNPMSQAELSALFSERNDFQARLVTVTIERDELRAALKGLLAVIQDDYRVSVTVPVKRARKAVGL